MTREEAIDIIKCLAWHTIRPDEEDIEQAIKALNQEPCEDMGEVSDGYHTFNQLYYQRAVLFATIVKSNKDKAWKSFKHSDGKYCFDRNGEWFIVGIDTPQGSYTYHYEKKYWDMFDCKELRCGKEWDGHTEKDVTRLLSLEQEPKTGYWILADEQNKEDIENDNYRFICSECQCSDIHAKGTVVPYCWKCGAKMIDLQESEG